jgi:ATP-binding cassette subfamily B protein RaxB
MSLSFGRVRGLPSLIQAESSECGLVCLCMIAAYYGHHTDLTQLRERFSISSKGATLQSLIAIADQLGLSSRAVRVEMNELKELKCPALLHWNFDHFVVLKKISSKSVVIHDPAVGAREYSLAEVSHRFTGIALEFSPRQAFESGVFGSKLGLLKFWEGNRGLGFSLAQILVLSLLIQIFALMSPFYVQTVVDDVLIKNDIDLLIVLAFGFLGLTIVSVFSKAMRGFGGLYLVTQLNYNIGNSVMHHLMRLPLAYFEKRHTGDVVSRFASTKPIQEFITNGTVVVVIDGILSLSTLALIFLYSSKLATIVIAATVFYAIYRWLQFQPLRNANHDAITADAKLQTIFIETIRSLQGIKTAGREVERQGTWRNQFSEGMNTNARIGRLTIYHEAISGFLMGGELILVVYYGALEVIDGVMTIGMLYAFMAYRSQFSTATASMINQFIEYKMIGLHLDRVADIVHTDKELGLGAESEILIPIKGQLDLEKVSFSYSTMEEPLFRDFSVRINPGDFLAIQGPSGIGKSTLIKLLMGLLPPTSGRLTIDGFPIDTVGLRSFRRKISAVMQDDVLFTGNLKNNIAFFDLEPRLEDIVSVCEIACIHQDIQRMPMGYDSLIGDMGCALSMGQQQRILLARALYSNPSIIFLDEGTAHVDLATEDKIFTGLKALGTTCVYISHNPQLARHADIVVDWSVDGPVVFYPQK